MEAMSSFDTSGLTEEELAYYTEVNARIVEKISGNRNRLITSWNSKDIRVIVVNQHHSSNGGAGLNIYCIFSPHPYTNLYQRILRNLSYKIQTIRSENSKISKITIRYGRKAVVYLRKVSL